MFDGVLGQTSLSLRLQTFRVTTWVLLLWVGLVGCRALVVVLLGLLLMVVVGLHMVVRWSPAPPADARFLTSNLGRSRRLLLVSCLLAGPLPVVLAWASSIVGLVSVVNNARRLPFVNR